VSGAARTPVVSPLETLAAQWRGAWVAPAGGFAGCCTPDVQYEDPAAVEPLHGIEALEAHAGRVRAALPDLRIEASAAAVGGGPFACVPWRVLGTQRGHAGDLPPTGRFVVVHGLHYLELVDGLVRRARGFFDLYDAAIQLGLLPARGSLSETALMMLRGYGLRPRA
jgi:predicted ester cyclase